MRSLLRYLRYLRSRAYARLRADARERRRELDALFADGTRHHGYSIVKATFGYAVGEQTGRRWRVVATAPFLAAALRRVDELRAGKASHVTLRWSVDAGACVPLGKDGER